MPENKEGGATGLIPILGIGVIAGLFLVQQFQREGEPPEEQPILEPANARIENIRYDIYSCE